MNLPPRPPQPTIQITSSVGSVPPSAGSPRSHGSARSKFSSQRSRRPLSRCEFDPATLREEALREEWLRNTAYRRYNESRVPTEYSYIVGRPPQKENCPPKASISIDIPSPLADRLFAERELSREHIWQEILMAHSQWYNFHPPPPVTPIPPMVPYQTASFLDSFELTCVFTLLTISTMFVFALLTFIYMKGFVKL